jgi:succinate dehydrogenase/fumarate reductase flavoprotein subunit
MTVEEFDVVVLGTGAAGLTAALRAAAEGASVGLFEKADTVGGTTAWSGGVALLPLNRHERDLGVDDDRETVLGYLASRSAGPQTDGDGRMLDVDGAPCPVCTPPVMPWPR